MTILKIKQIYAITGKNEMSVMVINIDEKKYYLVTSFVSINENIKNFQMLVPDDEMNPDYKFFSTVNKSSEFQINVHTFNGLYSIHPQLQ